MAHLCLYLLRLVGSALSSNARLQSRRSAESIYWSLWSMVDDTVALTTVSAIREGIVAS